MHRRSMRSAALASCLLVASLAIAPMSQSAAESKQDAQARFVKSPPTDRRNAHYISNRADRKSVV